MPRLSIAILSLSCVAAAQNSPTSSTVRMSFDDITAGVTPEAWIVEATNSQGSLALWAVTNHPKARSPSQVLSLTRTVDNSRGHFNIAWTPPIQFQNGEIQVSVLANAGRIDQGGGPIWRVQDANNYYVARYNPLESNFRIYSVIDGNRQELASAEDLDIQTGQWFTIRIRHVGSHIEGWLNEKTFLELDDDAIGEAGGIGVWTKDDAASSFDDLSVEPSE